MTRAAYFRYLLLAASDWTTDAQMTEARFSDYAHSFGRRFLIERGGILKCGMVWDIVVKCKPL